MQRNVILQGDALEVMRGWPDGCVDAVITDPPFGIDFKYPEYDDDPERYEEFMLEVVPELSRLVGDGPVFVWQAMLNADKWHRWFPSGFRIFAACKGMAQFRPTAVQYSWDPVIFFGSPRTEPRVGRRDYHVQRKAPFGAHRPKIAHPCPRPLEQVAYVVELVTQPGDLVLDPFMGSGTTAIAATKLDRDYLGIELNPDYIEIAERRLAQVTGVQLPLIT